MIESRYWKEDLLALSKKLSPTKNPPRWSEKRLVKFEKELIVAFFMIRRLTELKRVSDNIKKKNFLIYEHPAIKNINDRNYLWIDEVYDLDKEDKIALSLELLCNQFIHSGALYAYRSKDRNWGGVYVCSDKTRSTKIYRVPISTIQEALEEVGNNYPSGGSFMWSDEINDYEVRMN